MSKVTVKKLRLHWWQELLYLLFVMLAPIVVAACEIFSSHNTPFKISFTSVGVVLIAIIVVRKFVFKSKIAELQSKCVMKEHDYEIDVGDKNKLRKTWATYNMIILAYNAIVTMLSMLLAWLFISALSDQLVKFKGASTIILACCLVGILLKFSFLAYMTRTKEDKDVGESK